MFDIKLIGMNSCHDIRPSLLSDKSNHRSLDLSIIKKICISLSELNCLQFKLIAFNRNWPTNVRTDLVCVLEELPGLISWINQPKSISYSFDFYEQTMELFMVITRCDNDMHISGHTYSDQPLDPSIDIISADDLINMLIRLGKDFIYVVKLLYPDDSSNLLFTSWVESFEASITC